MRCSIARPLAVVLIGVCAAAAAPPAGIWLDVPYVKQERDGCGAACVAMVMQYWRIGDVRGGGADPQVILRALYRSRARGVYASDMERYLREHGFRVFAFPGTWDDLEHHLRKGRPLIVCLETGPRDGPLHYVVVAGLDPARDTVLVNDPAERKLLELDRPRFLKSWAAMENWTLLAVPR